MPVCLSVCHDRLKKYLFAFCKVWFDTELSKAHRRYFLILCAEATSECTILYMKLSGGDTPGLPLGVGERPTPARPPARLSAVRGGYAPGARTHVSPGQVDLRVGNSIRHCIACHWRCSGGSSAGAMLHALQLKPYPIFSNGAEHCPVPSWRLCDFGAVYKCHESYDQDDLLTFIGRNVVPVA